MGWDDEGRMRLRLVLPLPPSDNKIYFNMRHTRVLTTVARKYKRKTVAAIAKVAALCPPKASFIKDVEYEVLLFLYFEKIINASWKSGTRTKKGKEKRRYKKLDTANRQKLVIDGVTEGIGIDDCHIFKVVLHKRVDPDNPRLVVIVREREARHGYTRASHK